MSPTHPDGVEENTGIPGEVTDNYAHPGWNLGQRRLMLSICTAVGILISLKGCSRIEVNNEKGTPAQSVPGEPLLPGLPGLIPENKHQ